MAFTMRTQQKPWSSTSVSYDIWHIWHVHCISIRFPWFRGLELPWYFHESPLILGWTRPSRASPEAICGFFPWVFLMMCKWDGVIWEQPAINHKPAMTGNGLYLLTNYLFIVVTLFFSFLFRWCDLSYGTFYSDRLRLSCDIEHVWTCPIFI